MNSKNIAISNSPTISIIVPLWNATEHIPQLINAIKAQTYKDFEAIIINGNSDETTSQALSSAIAEDTRFIIIDKKNEGAGAARNAGLNCARGTYISFIDADDVPYPRMLEYTLSCAQTHDADIVVFQSEHFDASVNKVFPSPDKWDATCFPCVFNPKEYAEDIFGTFRNWLWDKLFRREFLENEQLRFPELMRSEDLPFTCTALACAKRIALLDKILYRYTVNAGETATSTHSVAPLDIIQGCYMLKDALEKRNLFQTYRTSYIQWAGLACCINLLHLDNADAFVSAYDEMHNKVLHELGLETNERQSVGVPSAKARNGAAGQLEDEDIWTMLDIIEHYDLTRGTFYLMNYRNLLAKRHYDQKLKSTFESWSFRIGKTILAPLHAITRR